MDFPLKNKKIVVIGAGKSGVAASLFCAKQGAHVILMDDRWDLPFVLQKEDEIKLAEIQVIKGGLSIDFIQAANGIVVSPGVPSDLPILQQVQGTVPIIGEIELAAQYIVSPIVGITGTNGKSTVTTLCGEIAKSTGQKVFCGGNLGTPLIEAANQSYDLVVCELSSFQLETTFSLRCRAATILNLTPDHLDRYSSMDAYGQAKLRIFNNQRSFDIKVLNADDPFCLENGRNNPLIGPAYWFTVESSLPKELLDSKFFLGGAWTDGNAIVFMKMPPLGSHQQPQYETYSLQSYRLQGVSNRSNALAALLLMRASGLVLPSHIEQGLSAMKPLSHRMEWVAQHAGVDFYDDSKGTNVDAVVAGIRKFPVAYSLIAGGKDKGGDYTPLAHALMDSNVRGVVLIGQAASKIAQVIPSSIRIDYASSMEEAVQKAFSFCKKGDAVILSPACSSYDMFRDYLHRAEEFKRSILTLSDKPGDLFCE